MNRYVGQARTVIKKTESDIRDPFPENDTFQSCASGKSSSSHHTSAGRPPADMRHSVWDGQACQSRKGKCGGTDGFQPLSQKNIGHPSASHKRTLADIYHAVGNYNDIYVVFVERALSLLNERGCLGYILPHKFFNAQYGEALRAYLANGKHVAGIVHFGDQQVFDGATTYTCLMFLNKSPTNGFCFTKVNDLITWRTSGRATERLIESKYITASEWNLSAGNDPFIERLGQMPVMLGDISHLFVGLQTDADDVFILEEISKKDDLVLCWSKAMDKEYWVENEHLKPFLKGSLNIRRYCLSDVTKRLIFPYETRAGKSVLIDPKDYKLRYPLSWAYLEANKVRLAERNKGKMGHDWYGYVYKKNHTRFCTPKIVVPSLAKGSCFAADFEGRYYFVGSGGGGGGGYGIVPNEDVKLSIFYLLGILNSKLINSVIRARSTPFRGGYFALNRQYIERLPIRLIDFTNPADRTLHDKLVALVEKMLILTPKLRGATSESEKAVLQNAVTTTDAEIDRLVYELYGLTEAEIEIVEGQG